MSNTHIKEAPGFYRDSKTGAIINTNTEGYQTILESRKQKRELDAMKEKIIQLENLIGKLVNGI